MYDDNHLAAGLRRESLGHEQTIFARQSAGNEDIVLDYATFWHRAEKAAGALIGAGVLPGDRVAAQVDKSLASLELYIGTVLAGGVFLPLNTGYTTSEVAYFLENAEPTVVVCDPARRDALLPICQTCGVGHVLTLDGTGKGTFDDVVKRAAPIAKAEPRGADDLAAFLYTSGTTGRSKGAMITHGNLLSNAEVLRECWRFTAQDVLIHALPIFHTHGLFVATNVVLVAGASLLFHQKFNADAVIADLPYATSLMGVPTFYTRLLESPDLTSDATSQIRLFVSGSAPLLAETHMRWKDRTGHAILERYGMTETCMNTSNPYEGERRPGTVGFPLPGVEVRVTDSDGAALQDGEIGGIEIRGANVFKGYWRMPEKTAEELRPDGFFITGDVGVIDADGYITIVGRSKDLIISGGYNIYPKEIELLVDDVEGVKESAVFGIPHPDFGETVAVAIVRAPGEDISAENVVDAVAPHLAKFKHPRHVVFLDALPRNTMGKVQKNQLRETYRDVLATA